ncbi:protein ripply2-like [Myxocyprinus asiaticus]|uniref:protein ripply2-like n=1 Tax=Myxocyprinus asiaticus TaxID=70543 RepID=UPI00222214D6|nr:protein ripply2-like [Myxocyprinus asiaticus]
MDTMEGITFTNGFNSTMNAKDATQPWRPWIRKEHHAQNTATYSPCEKPARNSTDVQQFKLPVITHPVKLFWPKSRCFDYLYQDAEILLKNYPVQATICLYEESDSDEDEDEDEKDLN